MTDSPARPQVTISEWKEIVAPFQVPSLALSIWQIVNTMVPLVACWYLMWRFLEVSYWYTLGVSVIAGLLVVRVFIIFHDCGHGSFFKSKRANDIVGFIAGMITFTPYGHWRWQHAVHHATSGDLDRRGEGDIWTLTVKEYLAASRGKRMVYRVTRNPFILLVIGPLFLFLLYQRVSSSGAKGKDRASVFWMNVALTFMVAGLCWLFGWKEYLMMQLPVTAVAGAAGIWMFYVQHQYEDVYWENHEGWNYTTAALEGSSFYKLPKILQWFTGNIGYHHVHHLSSKIPNYYLERCHNSHQIFKSVKPMTFWNSLKCASLRLWDEESRRLVGYSHLKKLQRA